MERLGGRLIFQNLLRNITEPRIVLVGLASISLNMYFWIVCNVLVFDNNCRVCRFFIMDLSGYKVQFNIIEYINY